MDPYSDAIEDFLSHLLAGIEIQKSQIPTTKFSKQFGDRLARGGHTCGYMEDADCVRLWYPNGNIVGNESNVSVFEIRRVHFPLFPTEKKILARIPEVLEAVMPNNGDLIKRAHKLAIHISFGDLVIARFLRRGNTSRNWTPAISIQQLKDLTFERYEGKSCTSGFLFTAQFELYKDTLDPNRNLFVKFDQRLRVERKFFAKPSSFRYVDGRNSLYVIDRGDVVGIVRLSEPEKYSIIDRCNHEHFANLVEKMPGRVWAAFAGMNSDLNVIQSGGVCLQWSKNRWHCRDSGILVAALKKYGLNETLAKLASRIVISLSTLRIGSILFFPSTDNVGPTVLKTIDESAVGKSVRKSFIGRPISDLVSDHSIIGLLGSDGMTTISPDGHIVRCGEIIDNSVSEKSDSAGASGSQAAQAAGKYGVAIKVSEDGPISIFSGNNASFRF